MGLGLASTFRGLGQEPGVDWALGVSSLREINRKLIQMETWMASHGPDPTFASLYREINDARQQYNDLVQKFLYFYRAAFGEVPAGLQGLGVDVVTVGLTAAAVLAAILFLSTYTDQLYQAWMARAAEQTAQAQSDAQIAQAMQAAGATANEIAEALEKNRAGRTPAVNEAGFPWLVIAVIGVGAYFLASR